MTFWPSLKAELRKVIEAKTGHEDKPPLHADQSKGLAYEFTRELTAAEKARMHAEIDEATK